MTVDTVTAAPATTACAKAARAPLVERRLDRFPAKVKPAVRALAARHPRLADLALSFPALLLALAVPRQGFAPEPVADRVIAGEPLASLAGAAAVPLWLRRLMPEAFERPLPRLPDGAMLRRQIVNHLPRSPRRAPGWLVAVAEAAELVGEPFAVWIAREAAAGIEPSGRARLRLLGLWAWASGRPDTLAGGLVEQPWTASMRYTTALGAARAWRERVVLHACIGNEPLADMWLEPTSVGGLELVPLASEALIRDEARHMRNCLMTYAETLLYDRARLWSIRRGGERVATLELVRRRNDHLLSIAQLRGPNNARVGDEVWLAACQWLLAHDLLVRRRQPLPWGSVAPDRARWVRLWRPYWMARRRIPQWLPLAPSLRQLAAL